MTLHSSLRVLLSLTEVLNHRVFWTVRLNFESPKTTHDGQPETLKNNMPVDLQVNTENHLEQAFLKKHIPYHIKTLNSTSYNIQRKAQTPKSRVSSPKPLNPEPQEENTTTTR